MAETWRIERHSGAGDHGWWTLASGDEWTLRDMFEVLTRVIESGRVRLIRPPGEIVRTFAAAPGGARRAEP